MQRRPLPADRIHRRRKRRNCRRKRFRFISRRHIVWQRLLPFLLLVACLLYALISLIIAWRDSAQTRRTNAELEAMMQNVPQEIAQTTFTPESMPTATAPPTATPVPTLLRTYQYIGTEILLEAQELYARNSDLVGWLKIPGGIVDLPVVYRDNTYYLDHDFYGRKSTSGTLFLDEAHPLREETQILVIHGHNVYDGSMFGLLSHYRRRGYMDDHPTVYLNTIFRKEEYQVVGVLMTPEDISAENYVPYVGRPKFKTVQQFNDFIATLRANARDWNDEIDILPSNALLMLSTCYEDERIVVVCVRK